MHTPDAVTVVIAPTMRRFLRTMGNLSAASVAGTEPHRVLTLPADDANICGFSRVSLLIIDEAARAPNVSATIGSR